MSQSWRFLSAYLPLKTQVCAKCKSVIAESKELIRITRDLKNLTCNERETKRAIL